MSLSTTVEKPGTSGSSVLDDIEAESLLVTELEETLFEKRLPAAEFDAALSTIADKHGPAAYAELLFMLTHLRFVPMEARMHWEAITRHREMMGSRLGAPVDLRVGLISYFIEVNRQLENPKVIEMQLFHRTQNSATVDELTGLRNFRYFRDYLERELVRADRFCEPLSLIMIDVDYFKQYNDSHGHQAGNDALAALARTIEAGLRKVDLPARYGGEEFAVVLPSTPKLGGHQVAERIRAAVDAQSNDGLTISLGVATFPVDGGEPRQLVRSADRALYLAKSNGRNQVQLYNSCRRSHRRIPASLNGTLCCIATDVQSMTTINISEGGLLIFVDRNLPVGSLIELELQLQSPQRKISTTGRVVRVEHTDGEGYEAAVRVVEIERQDRIALHTYLEELRPKRKTRSTPRLSKHLDRTARPD